ncbi:MAG TPA: hypothetical protein VII73_13065 [Caulobacteraceae bacterium]
MAAFVPYRRPRPRVGAPKTQTRRRTPPSAALINAILEHADLRDELGGNRLLLRLSAERLADARVRRGLGADAARLAQVAVIWDEREEMVFRVLDGGPPPIAAVPRAAPDEDDHFVLTDTALAYIERSQPGRR